MKKLVLLALLLFPLGVFAADGKVLTVETKVEGNTINYEGTTEEGVTAVMCKLYDQDGSELDMLSSAVDNKAFSAAFENVDKGTYTVYCARYEGGEIVSAEAVVETAMGATPLSNNPQTYDAGVIVSIVILAISVAGITGAAIYLKKKKRV